MAVKRTVCGRMVFLMVLVCGIGGAFQIQAAEEKKEYTHISQDEAKEMMAEDDDHIIIDVRTQEEYDSGHISGAICIPNESIIDEQPEELPDLEQIILVYCRSGRRSKEASQKLADIGYTNVYEFGGILDWTGDIVTEEKTEKAVHTKG